MPKKLWETMLTGAALIAAPVLLGAAPNGALACGVGQQIQACLGARSDGASEWQPAEFTVVAAAAPGTISITGGGVLDIPSYDVSTGNTVTWYAGPGRVTSWQVPANAGANAFVLPIQSGVAAGTATVTVDMPDTAGESGTYAVSWPALDPARVQILGGAAPLTGGNQPVDTIPVTYTANRPVFGRSAAGPWTTTLTVQPGQASWFDEPADPAGLTATAAPHASNSPSGHWVGIPDGLGITMVVPAGSPPSASKPVPKATSPQATSTPAPQSPPPVIKAAPQPKASVPPTVTQPTPTAPPKAPKAKGATPPPTPAPTAPAPKPTRPTPPQAVTPMPKAEVPPTAPVPAPVQSKPQPQASKPPLRAVTPKPKATKVPKATQPPTPLVVARPKPVVRPAITVEAPVTERIGRPIPVTIWLTANHRPLARRPVAITATAGRLSATAATTNRNGQVQVTVTHAPAGIVTVTATASPVRGVARTRVVPAPKPSVPRWALALIVAALLALLLLLLYQRRRHADDEHDTPDSAS